MRSYESTAYQSFSLSETEHTLWYIFLLGTLFMENVVMSAFIQQSRTEIGGRKIVVRVLLYTQRLHRVESW